MSSQHGHSRMVEFRRGQARYLPKTRIAAGGMAEVWRGEAQLADGYVEQVAIKRVLPALASNYLYRKMLEDEARLGMLLRHPNIVRVYDAREVRGTFLLVMELVNGPSLREVLGCLQQRGVPLSVPAAIFIAHEVARALEYAHESIDDLGRELQIIHRDVSPHNVLVGTDGSVKLMDFGLANATANLAERDPGMIGGKFGYLAPELVLKQEASPLIDLFALGVVLWESVTGHRLFHRKDDGETVRAVARCEVPRAQLINRNVSDDLQIVIDNLLAADPKERYQSAREVATDLDYLLAQYAPDIGPTEVSLAVRLTQGARASQERQAATQSGTRPRQEQAGVPRTSGVRASAQEPRLSDTFVSELEAMAARPQRAVPPPLPAPARQVAPARPGPMGLPNLPRTTRRG